MAAAHKGRAAFHSFKKAKKALIEPNDFYRVLRNCS